ncbi:MAG: S8 family serine peptidase [Planctomycetes bacterium]|nr:S8 family serine peptidase [Planctomycetota bacterium]
MNQIPAFLARALAQLGGAALLATITLPLSAQERSPLPPSGQKAAAPGGRPEALTPHREHALTELPALPLDESSTAELAEQPKPGFPGDEFGQQALRPFLLGSPYRLAFVGGEYVPPAGERIDPQIEARMRAQGGVGETYGFVMFEGRITSAKRSKLEALGLVLREHHTFNCMTATIPFAALPALAQLDCVRWVGWARPWQKLAPSLAERLADRDATAPRVRVLVKCYRGDLSPAALRIPTSEAGGTERAAILGTFRTLPMGESQRAFEALGAEVIDYHDGLRLFALDLPVGAVEALLALDFVHSVEADARIEAAHDRSTRQIGVDYVRSLATNDGHDTVVGMMDSGMDLTHLDVSSHWYAGWGYDGQSPYTDSTGHGTHVMGTISGTGAADSRYRGMAPATGSSSDRRIYIAGIFDGPSANSSSNNALSAVSRFATPITISGITTPIPSVINHSWGVGSSNLPAGGWTGTDSLSIALDQRVFLDGQTHVVAAHNQGGASYASQNLNGVLQPAVAKLSLTVASCLDAEENGSLPGRPYFTSNKGPTGDGRLCPQVMAPGRWIRSVQAGTADQYVSFQGTSMATPHVTGVIAGLHTHYPWMKSQPAVTRAVMAATTNPYDATRSTASGDDSYYHRQGMGLIDAYKAHYQRDEAGGYLAGRVYGTFDAQDGGAWFEVDVPQDAERTFFVLAFDEKPASQGAVRACVHDLDLHLDVEPFSAGYDTGEFHATRAWDTWDWYGNVASIDQVRGKRVRVKIHPRVAPTGNDTVRYGVAYLIPRGATSPVGSIDTSVSKTLLVPNESFTLTATLDVPEYVQSNAFVDLVLPAAVDVEQLEFVDRAGLPRLYSGASTPLDWTLGAQGHWFAAAHRQLTWTLEAPATNGSYQLCSRLQADNRVGSPQDCVTICVDDQPPFLIGNVASPSHPEGQWVNSTSFVLQWTPTNDVGCAGLAGYSYSVAYGAPTTPSTTPTLGANASSLELQLGTSAQDRYIALRAIDANGNANVRSIHGPVRIDTVLPAIASVELDGGAAFVTATAVAVAIDAIDAHSGLWSMRWSWNGLAWSAWTPYSATAFGVELTGPGGNANEGSKTLRVQVRDHAGNVSATASDSITHLRCPSLRGMTNATALPNLSLAAFEIAGADLADVDGVWFDGQALPIGTTPPFGDGRCELVDDGRIRVYPPLGLPAGNHSLQVGNRACRSNVIDLPIVLHANPVLVAPAQVAAGEAFRVFVSRGGLPPTTQIGLAVSPLALPSLAPGVVEFEIGAQFGALLLFPDLQGSDPLSGTSAFVVPSVPAMAGGTLHVEAFLIDPAAANPLPVSTTNFASIAFS